MEKGKRDDSFKTKGVASESNFQTYNVNTKTDEQESTGNSEEVILLKGKDRKPNLRFRTEEVKEESWTQGTEGALPRMRILKKAE